MSENGIVATKDTEQAISYDNSVKQDDFAKGNIMWMFPAFGFTSLGNSTAVLPRRLPAYNRYAFYTERDQVLLSTVHHESMWAIAVATAVTKAAAWGWEVTSEIPLRRKRLQELLMYATAGVFVGWVPFISAHLRSYLMPGKAFVEIERESLGYGSRITGLHHLNPLRCRLTDNPQKPVEYMDRMGRVHQLWWHQVMIFGDQVDPTEGDYNATNSAGERAYDRVKTMEAIHIYLYEKVTGVRPLSLEFIQGINQSKLDEAKKSMTFDQARTGSTLFAGVMTIPIMGDVPITRVSIPIAEVPDGFEYQEIHDNSAVDYCGAIGLDVNDLDPRLAQRVNLGSGAQTTILSEKAKGKGLAAWREDFTQQLHRLAAGTGTTFAWSEDSLDDETKREQLADQRTERISKMVERGFVDVAQGKNMLVDAGDMPREYLETDETADVTVESEENPNEVAEKEATTAREVIQEEWDTAVRLAQGDTDEENDS